MVMRNVGFRIFFIVASVIFLGYAFLLVYAGTQSSTGLQGTEFIQFGVATMCFSLAYLYPQFKVNDERTQKIKERGMFYTFLIMMGVFIALMTLSMADVIHFNGMQTVGIITAIMISVVFLSFVVLSKRY
ncbi:DUF2178 domain-containing protein [Geomicrobium sp. JCM 19039]|uniref:DUF2178 domain-containing protein n=1 Tax=Geomicrobium sp. JCM 19039 TaxID=1460636 RepID=UPI0005A9C7B5|nr:DUF2178 domain-containing protein [Geomicrobium sp. JCM 19039]